MLAAFFYGAFKALKNLNIKQSLYTAASDETEPKLTESVMSQD